MRQRIPNFIRSFPRRYIDDAIRPSAQCLSRGKKYLQEGARALAGLRKSPSQQRGWLRSINIFTTVMNSNVPSGRFSDAGRAPVKLRVPAHSKSTSIDQSSASRKLVERVFSFRETPTNGDGAFSLSFSLRWKSLPRPFFLPRTHVRKNARANLAVHVPPDPIFRPAHMGAASNMARECVGGILPQIGETSKWMYHRNSRTSKGFPVDRPCFDYIFLVLNGFINLPPYIRGTCVYSHDTEKFSNNLMTIDR